MPAQPLTPDTPLTPQQETFVTNLVVGGMANATQAALDANYSPANARQQASRLLSKANVKAAVKRKQAAIAVRTDYSVAQWTTDTRALIAQAVEAGAYGPAMKGYELLGRNIGALNSERGLSMDDKESYTVLGALMERYKSEEAREQAIEGVGRLVGEPEGEQAGKDEAGGSS